jgi:hypothetical protein
MATYNIETPTVNSIGAYLNSPLLEEEDTCLGINHGVRFGMGFCETPYSKSRAGISSVYTATSPDDFGGWYTINQMIDTWPSATPAAASGDFGNTDGAYFDDGCWFADFDANSYNHPPAYFQPLAPAPVGTGYDIPGFVVAPSPTPTTGWTALQGLTANESFQDHFLFRPGWTNAKGALVNSVWVSIGQLFWSWGGNATDQNVPFWSFGAPYPWASPAPGNVNGSSSSWLPSWNYVFLPAPPSLCPAPTPTALPPELRRRTSRFRHDLHKPHYRDLILQEH